MTPAHPARRRAAKAAVAGLFATMAVLAGAPLSPLFAQSLAVGTATGLPGTAVDVSVSFTAGATGVSSLQFDLGFASALTYVSTAAGAAATAAGKTVQGNPVTGGLRVIIFALNTTAISSGSLAVIRFNISGGATPGIQPITISAITASDPNGNGVPTSGSNGSVTVSAPADTTPPVLSSITASSITQTSAVVTWTTNEPSDTQVEYGTTLAYGNSTALNTSMVTSHSASLSGLTAGTLYHYRVKSRDAAGNLATSGDYTFTTTAASDTSPPVLSSITASSITQTSAVVTWTTNEPSDTQVEYGTTAAYGGLTALDTSMVTSHAASLTGLTAGTLYHYRVRSRDAAGNLALSGDYMFTTANAPDTTPPVLSSIAAAAITQNSAVVTWTTNEASDTQVEYGTSTAYGASTSLDTSMVTFHSASLGGLTASTLYHYRVRSRDAAGNLSVSGDYTFTTAAVSDTTPPVITGVAVTSIAANSAIINWTTNEDADGEVEFGTTAAYGSSTNIDPQRATVHSRVVNGLSPKTLYHFRVKSRDAAGNLAVSADYTFTTKSQTGGNDAAKKLFFPRAVRPPLQPGQSRLDDSEYTGVALANLDIVEAEITFTALDPDGREVTGPNMTNPVVRTLRPGEQLPIIETQLFGDGIAEIGAGGYIQVVSSVTKIAGFFMVFNAGLSVLDGANLATVPLSTFVLPEIEDQGYTRLNIANPGTADAVVRLDLIKQDGTVRASTTRTVKAQGALVVDNRTDLFPGVVVDSADYLRGTADRGVVPFEVLGKESLYVESLSGQDANAGETTLYSPQFASGGPWRSALSIVNLEGNPATVTMRLIGDDGTQIGVPRTVPIAAYGKIHAFDAAFFDAAPAAGVVQGYVEIRSNVRLTGAVVFGDPERKTFSSALPLVARLQDTVFFAQVASNEIYFTGLAILNPNTTDAVATVDLFGSDGRLEGSVTELIPARQRKAKVLTQFFPTLVGQNRGSGYIRVTVNMPVASFALFGTSELSVLSAIPPQEMPQ